MREPAPKEPSAPRDPNGDPALPGPVPPGSAAEAARRLEQAVARLEAGVTAREGEGEGRGELEAALQQARADQAALQAERDSLAQALETAQEREQALEAAAAAASAALGRAAAEVRSALGETSEEEAA